jgi:hypothetical protein
VQQGRASIPLPDRRDPVNCSGALSVFSALVKTSATYRNALQEINIRQFGMS